jgi:hypothetical protein
MPTREDVLARQNQLEDVKTSYFDNADYFETNSLEKARAFVTACVRLLPFLPKRMKTGGNTGSEIELSMDFITAQHDAAVRWIRLNDSGLSCAGSINKLGPSIFFRG